MMPSADSYPVPAAPAPPAGLAPNAPNPFGVTSSVLAVPAPARAPMSAPPVGMDGGAPRYLGNQPEPMLEADMGMIRAPGRNRRYLIAVAIIVAFALGAFIAIHLMRWSSGSDKPGRSATSASASPTEEPIARAAATSASQAEDDEAAPRNGGTERAPPSGVSKAILGATVAPSPAAPPVPPNQTQRVAAMNSVLAGLGSTQVSGPGVARVDDRVTASGLDATAIQRTVRRYSPGVRQNCWQRALNARAPGVPSSAKVSATITVDAAGHVQAVTVAGTPKGYPGLSRCIEGSVRGWQFPRSAGPTITNVPFMFVGQ
jgi:hypothetical protein